MVSDPIDQTCMLNDIPRRVMSRVARGAWHDVWLRLIVAASLQRPVRLARKYVDRVPGGSFTRVDLRCATSRGIPAPPFLHAEEPGKRANDDDQLYRN